MNAKRTAGNRLRAAFDCLRRPSAKYSLLTLLAAGVLIGVVSWGGFNTAMEATNTLEFCIGCHEMKDNVYAEYKETVHYQNRSGVRAVCADCHVPKDWTHKIVRKIKASKEVYGALTGKIDTKEKFEAHRMEMAERTWAAMKANDSRECRNCHSFDTMAAARQKPKARENHARARQEGKTCIDCHKGIAHLLPKEYIDPEE